MDRRSFLTASGGGILVSSLPYAFATEGLSAEGPEKSKVKIVQSKRTIDPGLSRRQWKTIITAQDHLFPSESSTNGKSSANSKPSSPGAKDVNAKAYFYAVLADADRDDVQLNEFSSLAQQLGMDVLVEVHDQEELDRALFLQTTLIGINNRNLRTFETSLETTTDLLSNIPDNRIVVTESGIHTPEDIQYMYDRQVNTFLVGEAFMRANNPGEKLHKLFFSEK